MSSKDYLGAIKLYTEAIKLNPKNAVYYSNRAAAYSQAGEHHNAINDAKKALEIDPSYSKAYSRLGLAYFSLEQYEDALKAYKNGLELDPNNTVMKESLETTRKKLEARSGSSGNANASSSRSASGGANSMPDLSSLLSNPAMRDMAAQMMQNPEMMRM
jgi:small glutamine-rich tetratricopeptide repeat-containing protein alpha